MPLQVQPRPQSFSLPEGAPLVASGDLSGTGAIPSGGSGSILGGAAGPLGSTNLSWNRRDARRSQSRFFSLLFKPDATASQRWLLNGLRVRMGVASGVLPADTEVRSSAVFDLAKGEP